MSAVSAVRHCAHCGDDKRVQVERGTGWWCCPVCNYGEAPRWGSDQIPPLTAPTVSGAEFEFSETLAILEVYRQRMQAAGTSDGGILDAVESLARTHFDRPEEDRDAAKRKFAEEVAATVRARHLDLASRSLPKTLFAEWSGGGAPRESKAIRVIDRATSAGAQMVVLSGPPGSGKTYACARALWDRCLSLAQIGATEPPGLIMSVRKIGRVARTLYGEEARAMRQKMHSMGLLIIDDLGLEDDAETLSRELTEILDERAARRCATWITTNLDRPAIEARYDGRVVRRLVLDRAFVPVRGGAE